MESASRLRAAARWPAALLLTLLAAACNRPAPAGVVRVEISHFVGGQPLQLGETEYEVAPGVELSLQRLRYYLGALRLRRADGSWVAPVAAAAADAASGYHLVDAQQPDSRVFELSLPPGAYGEIEFLVGVDPERNAEGPQTGALDPANGMFWTWNSGYIFFMLEGESQQSGAEDRSVRWHLGGRGEPTLARSVVLPLGGKPLQVKPEVVGTVHLHADLASLFAGEGAPSLALQHTVMDAAEGAPLADRYAGLFRVDHVHHEPAR